MNPARCVVRLADVTLLNPQAAVVFPLKNIGFFIRYLSLFIFPLFAGRTFISRRWNCMYSVGGQLCSTLAVRKIVKSKLC